MRRQWANLQFLFVLAFPAVGLLVTLQNDYWQNVWYNIMLFVAMSSAWNLMGGFTGYVSVGHMAFLAIGGYVAGQATNLPLGLTLLIAGAVSTIVGLVFAASSLRIRGMYFALVTLGMAEMLRVVALHAHPLTGGPDGMSVLYRGERDTLILGLSVLVAGVIALSLWLRLSRHGQRLVAIRCDEIAAASSGIHVSFYKVGAFLLSAFITGMVGSFYAWWLGFIDPPDLFQPHRWIAVLAMNVVGGMYHPWGPVIGSLLLGIVSELTWVNFPFLHQVVYGLAMLIFALRIPDGILGQLQQRSARARLSRVLALRRQEVEGTGVAPVTLGDT